MSYLVIRIFHLDELVSVGENNVIRVLTIFLILFQIAYERDLFVLLNLHLLCMLILCFFVFLLRPSCLKYNLLISLLLSSYCYLPKFFTLRSLVLTTNDQRMTPSYGSLHESLQEVSHLSWCIALLCGRSHWLHSLPLRWINLNRSLAILLFHIS